MTIRVRTTSAILCALLLAGTSAVGGPVRINDVIQVTATDYSLPKLRLREAFQSGGEFLVAVNASAQGLSGLKQTARSGFAGPSTTTAGPNRPDSTDSLLSGIAVDSDMGQTPVSVIGQGKVDGTICDCGEITVLDGAFPKWTLLFLGAIPLSFIHGTEETLPPTSNPTSKPTPAPISTPTPTVPLIPQVPEPASLLLLGSALAALASFRRRASAKRADIQEKKQL